MKKTVKRTELQENAEKALAERNAAPKAERPATRTAGEGMRPLPNQRVTSEGALEAEGAKPALERSHKAR